MVTYLKALSVLLLMFTVYGIVEMIVNSNSLYIKEIYLSLLPTYVFFVFSKKKQINMQWIKVVFFLMAVMTALKYNYEVYRIEEILGLENATINVGYELLALIPLVCFFKDKPIVQYVLLAIISAAIISTAKRGAIIINALCLLFFFYNSQDQASRQNKWYIWLLVIIFVMIGVRYVINYYENSDYFQLRIEKTLEGNSSGRQFIYKKAWSVFTNSGIWGLLFGHGAFGTIRIIGIEAHNDWLELLVNQGILGFFVYLSYWIVFYKTYTREINNNIKTILGLLIIVYFGATIISMSYKAMYLPANLALGYCLSGIHQNKEIEKKQKQTVI